LNLAARLDLPPAPIRLADEGRVRIAVPARGMEEIRA
jgi:hypothetical protein